MARAIAVRFRASLQRRMNPTAKIHTNFDPITVEWRQIRDPRESELNIDLEYSLLGYDLKSGRFDMLLCLAPGGHCRSHRHGASAVTLVLEGEQRVTDIGPDGPGETVVRRKGDYAPASTDVMPHLEEGGSEGCTVLFSMQAPDGILFEYFDKNMENGRTLSIAEYVEAWNNGKVYGAPPPEAA